MAAANVLAAATSAPVARRWRMSNGTSLSPGAAKADRPAVPPAPRSAPRSNAIRVSMIAVLSFLGFLVRPDAYAANDPPAMNTVGHRCRIVTFFGRRFGVDPYV